MESINERAGLYPAHNTLVQDSDANHSRENYTTVIHFGEDDNTPEFGGVSSANEWRLLGDNEHLSGLKIFGDAAVFATQGFDGGSVMLSDAGESFACSDLMRTLALGF